MGPLCKWAVMRCAEPRFQEWVTSEYRRRIDAEAQVPGPNPEPNAARCLMALAGVSSRKELDEPEIAERFKAQIMRPYGAWLGGVTA